MDSFGERLKKVIPGGAHTYSRGRDQFPQNAPVIAKSAKGCFLTDNNGIDYIDYGMGLRSITLGYANQEVNEAVVEALNAGNCFTIPHEGELAAAEKLVELVSSIDMVKFCKNGSNATTAAIKLARAYTGKTKIMRCSDHPFFSFDDWFIGTTPVKRGIPTSAYKDTINFSYSDLAQVEQVIAEDQNIACLIMEPAASKCPMFCETKCLDCSCPDHEFNNSSIMRISQLCEKNGIVFILDETITGFRWDVGGAQKILGVTPDLTIFGKGMANGYSLACVGGKREIMDLGSIDNVGEERIFLLSSTHGAEATSLAAFVKSSEISIRENVCQYLWKAGSKLKNSFNKAAAEFDLGSRVLMSGPSVTPVASFFNENGEIDMVLRTFFLQEMVKQKFLIPWISPSFSHNSEILERTEEAFRLVFENMRAAIDHNKVDELTLGQIVKPVFRKFN